MGFTEFNIEEVVEKFKSDKKTKNGNIKVIGEAKKHVIKSRCKNLFRMHSLRNRASIKLLVNGRTEQEVQAAIGWRSISSLYRYTVLTITEIEHFNSYQEIYEYIMSNKIN